MENEKQPMYDRDAIDAEAEREAEAISRRRAWQGKNKAEYDRRKPVRGE